MQGVQQSSQGKEKIGTEVRNSRLRSFAHFTFGWVKNIGG